MFLLFAWTRPRTLPDFDAAEFLLLARRGGIAHPPGYPLYTVALRGWATVVGDSVATLTLLSALCCSLAAGTLCFVLERLTSRAPAVLATLVVMTAAPLWRVGTNLEPFALHLLLTALLCAGLVNLFDDDDQAKRRGALLAGTSLGLGLCHHHTLALAVPSVLAAMLWSRQDLAVRFGWFTFGASLGVLPLFHFFVEHSTAGFVWGDWTSPLSSMWTHLLRREYGTFSLGAATEGSPVTGLMLFASRWLSGLSGVFALPCLIALRTLPSSSSRARVFWGLSLVWLLAGPGFASLLRIDDATDAAAIAERFFAMPLLLTGPFLAVGLSALLARVSTRRAVLGCVALLLCHIVLQLQQADRRRETLFAAHAAAVQQLVPEGALFIGSSDVDNSVGLALRATADAKPFHHLMAGLFALPWYQAAAQATLDVAVAQGPLEPWVQRAATRYTVVVSASAAHHDGVLWTGGQAIGPLVRFGGHRLSSRERLETSLALVHDLSLPDPGDVTPWEDSALEEWRAGLHFLALELEREGQRDAAQRARDALSSLLQRELRE